MIPPEKSAEFVANMERVLDVYKRPYNRANPVICMDETPKQLIAEGREQQKMKSGRETRIDYEYIRQGVVNVFMANEPLRGKRYTQVTEFKTMKEWALFIDMIATKYYPKADKITLVMDNLKHMWRQRSTKRSSLKKPRNYGTDWNLYTLQNMVAG